MGVNWNLCELFCLGMRWPCFHALFYWKGTCLYISLSAEGWPEGNCSKCSTQRQYVLWARFPAKWIIVSSSSSSSQGSPFFGGPQACLQTRETIMSTTCTLQQHKHHIIVHLCVKAHAIYNSSRSRRISRNNQNQISYKRIQINLEERNTECYLRNKFGSNDLFSLSGSGVGLLEKAR